jgi:outer membrane receptor protein involved in Fe transport
LTQYLLRRLRRHREPFMVRASPPWQPAGRRALVVLSVIALFSPWSAPRAQPAPAPESSAPATAVGVVRGSAGEPIAGATVRVAPDGAIVLTDADGRFAIAAAPGATLVIEADGYDAGVVATGEAALEIALIPIAAGEVIEMVGEKPTAVAGAVTLSREELATLPGTGGDLLASLDSLPGITAPSGFGPPGQGVIIRGSAPEDSRILLDGFDIPQLYHFLNRSIIPTRAVEGLEYLPGGFDVRYGRASSGIVSITSRGGGDEVEGSAEVSVIDANVLGAGPVGKDGHVLASFRRSYIDTYLSSLLPDDVGLVTAPRYYDGLLRLDWDLNKNWRGAVTVIGSSDLTELVGTDDETAEEFRFRADTKFLRAISAATWRGGRGVNVDVGTSLLTQSVSFQFDDEFLKVDQLSLASRLEISQRHAKLAGLTDVVLRAGTEVDPRRYTVNLELEQRLDEGQVDDGMDGPLTTFDGAFWLTDIGVWTAIEASLSRQLRFSAGLRVDAFTRNGSYPVQPRGELTYRPDEVTKIRLAAGRYTRAPENGDELLTTALQAESATQITMGIERKLGMRSNVQLTLYNTERTDLITRDEMNVYRNQGRGHSYGIDTMASYRSDGWFGWLSYSFSRSSRRDTPTSEDRLFDFDQTHDLVAALSYKTQNKLWQFGGKFTYTSGQPTTPVLDSVYDSDLDLYLPQNGSVNSERLRAHHQLDLRIDRFWRLRGWTLSAFLDVNNAYLNAKVEQYQYNYDYSVREEIKGLPIVPQIGIRGEI